MPETRVQAVHAFARAHLYSPAGFIAYMPDLTPEEYERHFVEVIRKVIRDQEMEQARIRLLCT